jgi:hypothetical protein
MGRVSTREDAIEQHQDEDDCSKGVVAMKDKQNGKILEQQALMEFVEIVVMVQKREDGRS